MVSVPRILVHSVGRYHPTCIDKHWKFFLPQVSVDFLFIHGLLVFGKFIQLVPSHNEIKPYHNHTLTSK